MRGNGENYFNTEGTIIITAIVMPSTVFSCEISSESPVLESEALVVELVVAVGAVPLVVAPPHVRDAEPAPAAVLAARARQAVHSLGCNR